MPMQQAVGIRRESKKNSMKDKPLIIQWKGAEMIRQHSIRQAAHEIMNFSKNLDYVKVNIIGKQSTGKTELAKTVGHLIHDMAEVPYALRFYSKEDLLNFRETLATLEPMNQILIFDDVSFLGADANKKQIDQLQAAITTIRHLPGGKDVKIILITNFHYTKSIPPLLRQNDFTFYSSVDPADEKNIKEMVGSKHHSKIDLLASLRRSCFRNEPFTFQLGKKFKFSYVPKAPFLPFLFDNGDNVRFIVAPKREWVKPLCPTCVPSKQTKVTTANLEKFREDFDRKFTVGTSKTAVKLKLFSMGINTFPKRVIQGVNFIDMYMDKEELNIEEFAKLYGLTITSTFNQLARQPENSDGNLKKSAMEAVKEKEYAKSEQGKLEVPI